jgi:hypothetical protein
VNPRFSFVLMLVAMIRAPGTTAEDESVTVPTTVAKML